MDIACGGDKLLIYDGKKDYVSLMNPADSSQCGIKQYYLRVNSISLRWSFSFDYYL